jgi:hypothetical protein
MIGRGVIETRVIACRLNSRGESTADPTVLETIAERARNQTRRLLIRSIDELCLPIEIEHRKSAARADHAHHFGESAVGVWNVHQHPFSSEGVESSILEAKRLSVAHLEYCGRTSLARAAARFEDHVFTDVDANRATLGADDLGDLERIVA